MALGVYRSQTSWLHRCDPRAKLGCVLLYLVAVVLADTPGALFLVTVGALLLWWGSGQGAREALRLLGPMMPLVLGIFLINAVCTFGMAASDGAGWRPLAAALESGILVALKLLDAFLGAATLMITTPPVLLTAALRWFLSPGACFGLKVDEAAFSLTMVLRFVPLLGEEAVRIRAAQTSRGASFDTGGFVARVQQWIPVITPLFVGALRRCDNVAFAVASRAFFAPVKHTSLVQLRGGARDMFLLTAAFVLMVAVILWNCLS